MSEHLLDNILEKETTRRDFLKTAAKGTAVLALGASLLSLVGCSSPMEQKGELTGLPLPQGMKPPRQADLERYRKMQMQP